MIQKIKRYLLPITMLVVLVSPVLAPIGVSAASTASTICSTSNIAGNVASGASDAAGSTVNCSSSSVSNNDIGKIAKTIVTIFSIIVGAISIIMIIYSGFRYITSGGDSGRIGNAKNTLIYAVIGLVIVALAQIIVQFVLHQSNNIANPPSNISVPGN